MRATFCILFLLLITVICNSQISTRKPGESPDAFSKRIFNVTTLAYPIIETNVWDANKKVIICFFEFSNTEERGILGYLLTPINKSTYQQTFIDSFNVSGGIGSVKIENVFFANTDIDNENEIVITTKSPIRLPRYSDINVQGNFFDNYFYDNYKLTIPPFALTKFLKLSEKFSDFEGITYDNETGKVKKREKSKYKDPKAVKLKLKEIGF